MAAFTTAEARAKAMMANKTWVVAHSERMFGGQIAVRFIRFMSAATLSVPSQGGLVETTDDAVS